MAPTSTSPGGFFTTVPPPSHSHPMRQTNATQLVAQTNKTDQTDCPQAVPPKIISKCNNVYSSENPNAYQLAKGHTGGLDALCPLGQVDPSHKL